jgi:hypothetical protein
LHRAISLQSADAADDAKAIDELRWHLTEMLKALDKPLIYDQRDQDQVKSEMVAVSQKIGLP